jgi:hypothetical protein
MKSTTQSNTPLCQIESEVVGQLERKLILKNEGATTAVLVVKASTQFILTPDTLTLLPGQSQEVTIRFNPATLEDFNGGVQVAIQNGQGELGVPTTGIMHKVSVDAARLDFGFVFVNVATDQKLKVANRGATVVSIGLSTHAPFSIVSPNLFTLEPGQNQEIVIRANPTVKGAFSGNVRFLFNGAVSKEFRTPGMAVTFEDYLLTMLNAHNTAAQAGDHPILFAKRRMTNLLLSGFENLTTDQMDVLLDHAATLNLASNDDQPSLEEMINALSPCVVQAIDDLSSRLDAVDFDNNVQIWKISCSAFDRLVVALENAVAQGYLTGNPMLLLKDLVLNLTSQDQDTKEEVLAIATYELQDPIVSTLLAAIRLTSIAIEGQIIALGVYGIYDLGTPEETAAGFALNVEIVATAFASCARCDRAQALLHLLGRLAELGLLGASALIDPSKRDGFASLLQGIYNELGTAAHIVRWGWDLIDYSRPVTVGSGSTEIDIIAAKETTGIGTVVAFIEMKSGSIHREQGLINQVARYAEYARQVMSNCASGGGCEVKANLYMVVFVFHNYTNPAEANWLASLAVTTGVPFLVIYCVANCFTPLAQYAIAHNSALSPSQALAIACDMGYCPPMQAEVRDPNTSFFTGIDPIIIAPTEPITSTSEECDGRGEYSTCY